MDNYLTTAQAAELLGMDRSAVLRAIRQGRLPATRYGPRVVLIKRDDVETYRAMPRHAGGRPRGSGASLVSADGRFTGYKLLTREEWVQRRENGGNSPVETSVP